MSKLSIFSLGLLLSVAGIGCAKNGDAKMNAPSSGQPMAMTYACPMHPDMMSDHPGKCPKCGMEMAMVNKH